MSNRLSNRISAIAQSATMAIDDKAKAMRAAGSDVIGFGAGEPDFPTPKHIVEAARAAVDETRFHHYTGVIGHPELRRLIADKSAAYLGVAVDPAQVIVTNGAKHAVLNALAAVLDPGDEILIPSPFWVTYPEAAQWIGGIPVVVETDPATGFSVDVGALEAARSERTKALLLCSPSNPTGAVCSASTVREIGEWAVEAGIWVITDDIYMDLVYDDTRFSSIVAEVPEIAEKAIVVNGVSKSYSMTGWRLGWLVAPSDAAKAIGRLQGHMTSNVNNIAQAAAAAAIGGDQTVVEEMRLAFDRRRRRMCTLLERMPGVELQIPKGAFYAFPSVEGVLGREIGGRRPASSLELAEILLDEAGVAVVPGEAFGAPGFLRLSYALGDDALEDGLTRMGRALGAD